MDVTAFNLARMELPEVRAMAELSRRPDLRQPRLSHSPRERIHQCGHPGTHA